MSALASNPRQLPADDFELSVAATTLLAPCPFCGRYPLTFTEQNPDTKLYIVRVICPDCVLSLSCCMETRDEARARVIERWSTRIPPSPTSNSGEEG